MRRGVDRPLKSLFKWVMTWDRHFRWFSFSSQILIYSVIKGRDAGKKRKMLSKGLCPSFPAASPGTQGCTSSCMYPQHQL